MVKRLKSFTVIVADLTSSRGIGQRNKVSNKIRNNLKIIEKKYSKDFYAPLVLTRGMDEMSGVLLQSLKSFKICNELNWEIYPERFRFAIVRGPLDVAVA